MDVKKTVAEVQLEILHQVIEREQSVALLYEKFADAFPDLTDLWKILAKEERWHAQIFQNMEQYILNGSLLWNLGRLTDDALNGEKELIEDANLKLRLGRLDPLKALKIAFEIENSILDSKFYDIVNCDLPEFQKAAKELRDSEEQHKKRLMNAMIAHAKR